MKNASKPGYRLRHNLFWLCGMAAVMAIQCNAYAGALDLANSPLLNGTNVKPNVMVAVDDSGSMDDEVLFPSSDGALYWDRNRRSFISNGSYNARNISAEYRYLFPNGCNNGQDLGKRVACDSLGHGSVHRYAIPPIPAFAFARSPDYNKEYFNPAVDYSPWLDHPNAWIINTGDITAVPYDPQARKQTNTIDLTHDHHSTQTDATFVLLPGMTLPKGTIYYKKGGQKVVLTSNLRITNQNQGPYGIVYFPATFYLNASIALPSGYGYTAPTPPPVSGPATKQYPDGEPLVRYQIKQHNFVDNDHYLAAIHNFANWFTYYRKRHLATRGGVVKAFSQISGLWAGSCTINQAAESNPQNLDMLNLDDPDNRQAFYAHIFDIDFFHKNSTPNRNALAFLGRQLEQNKNIIRSKCQKNYAILFTDGFNNGDVDSYGDADGDGRPNTIADIAMHYYKNLGTLKVNTDNNPDNNIERDAVPVPAACDSANHDPALDCETDLHMNTFGVTLGQSGTLFNGDGDNPNPYTHPPNWSSLSHVNEHNTPEQIDDLWHATVNSHGKLLNAQTPEDLANQFAGALKTILNTPGSASGVATNSASLSDDSVVYRATYQAGSWNGDLKAYSLAGNLQSAEPNWSAAEQLELAKQKPGDRAILTSLQSDNGDTPLAFRADTQTSQGSLARVISDTEEPPPASSTVDGKDIIDYIRGDRSKERGYDNNNNGVFRNRGNNILGDIVHSTPVYVGAPDRYRYPKQWKDLRPQDAVSDTFPENNHPYNDPTDPESFAQKYANRVPMIYVGANDGMLHGFDATTGKEKIAYIPNAVLPNLVELTKPNYSHRYYVDGSPVVGDVVFDNAWHTVLVGGERNGGNSIFALDVTDPADPDTHKTRFLETKPSKIVLWEYTDDDLGQTYGKPSIVRLHNGKWAAMFGNGYNSENNRPALYLVDISNGHLIRKMCPRAAPGNGNGNASGWYKKYPDGLSEPFPVDLDGDFITDYAYAGDLQGNLWKFDLRTVNSQPSDECDNDNITKLFKATQPITTQPQVGLHPYGKDYGVMVYFGTGKYLEKSDAELDPTLQNSLYGIWDANVFTVDEANRRTKEIKRSDLVKQNITQFDPHYRVVSNNPVNYQQPDNNSARGWILDLPRGVGELITSNPRINQGGTISFSTTIPSQQQCKVGGSGYFMTVDAATGGRTSSPAFDINGDHLFNDNDKVTLDDRTKVGISGVAITNGAPGAATHMIDRTHEDNRVFVPTSKGDVATFEVNNGQLPDHRVSWREIRR